MVNSYGDTMAREALTTETVVAAAADLADRDGLAGVTLSALARGFGVTTAGMYSHVGGAGDLLDRLSAHCLEESADLVAAAVAGRAGHGAVIAFGSAYRDYARAHPGRYAATRRPAEPEGHAVPAGRRHADLGRAVLREYALTPTQEVHAVRLLGSTIHGFISLESTGAFDHSRPSATASWTAILGALTTTIAGWADAGTRPARRGAVDLGGDP